MNVGSLYLCRSRASTAHLIYCFFIHCFLVVTFITFDPGICTEAQTNANASCCSDRQALDPVIPIREEEELFSDPRPTLPLLQSFLVTNSAPYLVDEALSASACCATGVVKLRHDCLTLVLWSILPNDLHLRLPTMSLAPCLCPYYN